MDDTGIRITMVVIQYINGKILMESSTILVLMDICLPVQLHWMVVCLVLIELK